MIACVGCRKTEKYSFRIRHRTVWMSQESGEFLIDLCGDCWEEMREEIGAVFLKFDRKDEVKPAPLSRPAKAEKVFENKWRDKSWKINTGVRAVVGEDGVGRLQYVENPHTPADAKLISAAPDMASELERLLDVVCDEDAESIKSVLKQAGWNQ